MQFKEKMFKFEMNEGR